MFNNILDYSEKSEGWNCFITELESPQSPQSVQGNLFLLNEAENHSRICRKHLVETSHHTVIEPVPLQSVVTMLIAITPSPGS